MNEPKRVFVTGIGTDIGKTVASAILTQALDGDYWKPVQAGGLDRTDTDEVRSLVLAPGFKAHPERHRLRTPMSPHAAAARDGVEIDIKEIHAPETQRPLIIEGAGGLLVPLSDRATIADLIVHLRARVVVVSRHYLGSINHTLLTAEALRARQIPVLGLLFIGEENPETEAAILTHSGLRSLGRIEIVQKVEPSWIAAKAEQLRPALLAAWEDSP